jgi:predicted ester cyclase
MSERNKAHMRRVVEEIYNQGNLAAVDELAASGLVIHAASQEIHGREGARQYVSALRAGFPDIRFTVEDQIAEGDLVVTRWTARGTHKGEFQGVAPTGREVRVVGIDIDRIVDGKTVECWAQVDELGMLRQLAPG